MRKRALFDVDGVLADFCRGAAAVMSRVARREISPEHISHWDVTKVLEDEGHRALVKTVFESPGFCASLEPYEGAREAVEEVRSMADVFFVTAPMHENRQWVSERVEWLQRHFGADPKDVVFAYNKYLVGGAVIVEDSPANAAAWQAHHPEKTALLWDRPYNRDEGHHLERVSSWPEALGRIREALR